MNSESLMTAYQKGSDEAFERLYDKNSAMVYGFVKKRLRDSEADDFYRNVWRELHKERMSYNGQPFRPWIFSFLDRLLENKYKSLGRTKERSERDETLVSEETPPHELTFEVKKDIQLSFRAKVINGKFFGYQILGSISSLMLCHQFGLGFYPTVDISRYGDGYLNGFIFMASGALVTFLGLKGEELWWVWRRYKIALVMMPILFWVLLANVKIAQYTPAFHAVWIVTAIVTVIGFFAGRSRYFVEFQARSN
jgi:hypothetical protein